jgi:HSF-type DNA-binding
MSRRGSSSTVVFPQALYDMLFILESEYGAAAAIGWQPHGRCFLIRDKSAFVQRIMPL